MIQQIISELGPWTWWIIGLLFLVIEIIAPGVFFLWIGLAAIIVGTNALLFPIAWQVQVISFAVLSLILAVVGRRFYKPRIDRDAASMLNERGKQYIGRDYILSDDMKGGEGQLKIGDTIWMIRAPRDLPAGSKVRISDADGSVLIVEAI